MIFDEPLTTESLLLKCAPLIPAWLIDALHVDQMCFIAGGFFQRAYRNQEMLGDIDVFCYNRLAADRIATRARSYFGSVIINDSINALTVRRPTEQTVQLIYDEKWCQPFSRREVVERFDIRSTQISLHWGKEPELVVEAGALDDIEKRIATLNITGVHSRFRTMARIANKISEGFFTAPGAADAIRTLMLMPDEPDKIPSPEEFLEDFHHRY